MVALRTHDIMIFGGNERQVASKNLLSEKHKGNLQAKQPRFKSRLKEFDDFLSFCFIW